MIVDLHMQLCNSRTSLLFVSGFLFTYFKCMCIGCGAHVCSSRKNGARASAK